WILLQLPYGILGVTVLTAIMPRLSRNAAEGNDPAVVDDLSVATRMTLVALVPIVVFLTFAGPWVGEALFGFGNFANEASRLGEAVSWSAFTLIPYALVLIHLRVFYAREQAWTPTWIILGITGVKIALSALAPFVASSDQQVVLWLGVANGLGFVVGACIGGFLLHRSLGDLRMINVGKTIWMVLLASAAGGTAMLAIDRIADLGGLTEPLGSIGAMLRVGFCGVIMLGITFSILWFGRIPEVLAVTVALRRLVNRARGVAATPPEPVAAFAEDKTETIPVVTGAATWETAGRQLPYPGSRRTGTPSPAGIPEPGRRMGRPGAQTQEGARVTDDEVAGGPAESVANGTDRATGGVEVDERTKKTPTQSTSSTSAASTTSSKSSKTEDAVNDDAPAEDASTESAEAAPDADATAPVNTTPDGTAPDGTSPDADSSAEDSTEDTVEEKSDSQDSSDQDSSEDSGGEPAADAATGASGTPAQPVPTPPADAPRAPRGPKLIPGASVAGGRYRLLAP
ncbi:MAG: lipid II flippase MurJ, partial [Rhodococcus sp. (in: high G+C Gram-positive bacteria)]